MFDKVKKYAKAVAAKVSGAALAVGLMFGAGASLLSQSAMAAPPDVTAVTTEISGAIAPIGLIGAGVLLVLVAVKTYKWIRRAM